MENNNYRINNTKTESDILPHRVTKSRMYNTGPNEDHNSWLDKGVTYGFYLATAVGTLFAGGIVLDAVLDDGIL